MLIRPKVIIGAKSKSGQSPLYPGSVFDVEDALAKRLVDQGVAEFGEILARPALAGKIPSENPPDGDNGLESPENGEYVKGHLDAEELESWSFADLKALAKDLGIETGKIKSKSGMISAITAVEVEAPADDELPDLTPQDVIEE